MWFITNEDERKEFENRRALVGMFVDRNYNTEKFSWLLEAKRGFDEHSRDAWHLLVPVKLRAQSGYGLDDQVRAEDFGVELAAAIIDHLQIEFADLPCIVFRAKGEECFFLKLGGMTQDQFYEEIGRVADLARECQAESKAKGQAFRDYVNMQVANHLRRRRILSATRSALPALSSLLGSVVDFTELV